MTDRVAADELRAGQFSHWTRPDMARALSPTESRIHGVLTYFMTVAQIRHVLSGIEGREVPYSTVSSALSNLERWGAVESFRAPNPRRNASRKSYRAVRKEATQ